MMTPVVSGKYQIDCLFEPLESDTLAEADLRFPSFHLFLLST